MKLFDAVIVQLDNKEREIAEAVGAVSQMLGFSSYLIGGFVRDLLLNRPTKDIDIVTVGDGIKLAKEVAQTLGTKKPVIYSRFGTAMLTYRGIEIEFVGARKESYSSHSRKPEVLPGTLEDDQNRRDFTINALAISLNPGDKGQLIDPFNGREDLENRILRTPLDPDRTFSDDPLRMMRAIRFATQLDFEIHPTTFQGIRENATRIRIVSQERITDELNKIIASPIPSTGFYHLLDTGLCEIIFYEFYKLLGVDYENGKGHKDNFYHTLEVVDNVAKVTENLWLRWAAVLHDIGKPRTKRYDPSSGWTFHGHDAVGASMVPKIFRRLKLPLDQKMKYVQKLVRLHLRPITLTKSDITDSAVRRLLFEAGEDIDDLMLLCRADITTKNQSKMDRYLTNYELVAQKMVEIEEKDRLRNWEPPISGEVIMRTFHLAPSREVGIIKNAIREAILDGVIGNNYDEAFQFMLLEAEKIGLHPVNEGEK